MRQLENICAQHGILIEGRLMSCRTLMGRLRRQGEGGTEIFTARLGLLWWVITGQTAPRCGSTTSKSTEFASEMAEME